MAKLKKKEVSKNEEITTLNKRINDLETKSEAEKRDSKYN